MLKLNKMETQKLQHMLGADGRYPKKNWGYRNYYCASVGGNDSKELDEMVNQGLVVKNSPRGDLIYYFATKKGAEAIGFKPYQLRNTTLAKASPVFYMCDSRSDTGDNVLFWRKKGNGYGTNLSELEIYNLADAQVMHDRRETNIPLLKSLVDELSILAVDSQYLPRESISDVNGEFIVQCKNKWNGNDICFVCHHGGETYDYVKAGRFRIAEVQARFSDSGLYAIFSKYDLDGIARRTFQVSNIDLKRMSKDEGIKLARPKRVRYATGKTRGNCPVCGKLTWNHNPHESYPCENHKVLNYD